jgi:hypothetical protein
MDAINTMDKLKEKIYFLIERYEIAKERRDKIFKEEGKEECRKMLVDAIIGNVRAEDNRKEN